MKIKCSDCMCISVWKYMPNDKDKRYFCDCCVPRGCSCNIDSKTNEEYTDELGRKLPCCEYDFIGNEYDYYIYMMKKRIQKFCKPKLAWAKMVFQNLVNSYNE